MIRVLLRQLLDDKSFNEGRRITLNQVAEQTGISRATLNRVANQQGYSASLDVVDALCRYFSCTPAELLRYVEDDKKNQMDMTK